MPAEYDSRMSCNRTMVSGLTFYRIKLSVARRREVAKIDSAFSYELTLMFESFSHDLYIIIKQSIALHFSVLDHRPCISYITPWSTSKRHSRNAKEKIAPRWSRM